MLVTSNFSKIQPGLNDVFLYEPLSSIKDSQCGFLGGSPRLDLACQGDIESVHNAAAEGLA